VNRYAFRGKPIDTLDRDEMLQALTQACKHIEELTGPTPAERAARFIHPAFPYENPRTPAETEAMLNHMADVHLTPTAEKGK
jgi:hypothetical protein